MKVKKMVKCPECKKDMKKIDDLSELPWMPVEWWKNPDIISNKDIYICYKCRRIETRDKTIYIKMSFLIGFLFGFILGWVWSCFY